MTTQSSPETIYPTLQDWLNEAEGYGVRAEHIPPGAYPWIAEAWKLGAASAGHAQGPASTDRADALYDSAYIAGLNLGFALGLENNHEKKAEVIAARDGYLSALSSTDRWCCPCCGHMQSETDKCHNAECGWTAA